MDAENNTITITPASLLKVLTKRFWILLIVGVLSFAVMFLYTSLTFVPQYESTGRLYILRQPGENDSQQNADYQVSLLVTADCAQILKDHVVVDAVIEELGLDMTYEQLSRNIAVENPAETRILYVTITAGDPAGAKNIADKVCEIGADVITNLMGEDQAKFYGEGKLSDEPSNTPSVLIMGLISLALMLVVYAVFYILFMGNDHIGSGESIEERLNVSILGDIPNANRRNKGRGYYGHYGKYCKSDANVASGTKEEKK